MNLSPGPLLATILLFFSAALSSRAEVKTLRYFRMGEDDPPGAVATTTKDTAGVDDITWTGTPLYLTAAGVPGSNRCLAFGGSADFTSYGTTGNWHYLTQNFGVEMWVLPGSPSGPQYMVYAGDPDASGWGIIEWGGKFVARFGGKSFFGDGTINPGQWTHLAFVCNDTSAMFYVNGVRSGEVFAHIPSSPGGSITIGARPVTNAARYSGYIDELRIFSFEPGKFLPEDLLFGPPKLALKIAQQQGNVFLEWPSFYPTARLQTSLGLDPPAWSDIEQPPAVEGKFSLTRPADDPSRFYRLAMPQFFQPQIPPPRLASGTYVTMKEASSAAEAVIDPAFERIFRNNGKVVFDASTFIDPATGTNASLTWHWTLATPEYTPYTCAGVTGYRNPVLTIGAVSIYPTPVTLALTVTSTVTNLSTTMNILARCGPSSLSLADYTACRTETTACSSCPCRFATALPTTEAD